MTTSRWSQMPKRLPVIKDRNNRVEWAEWMIKVWSDWEQYKGNDNIGFPNPQEELTMKRAALTIVLMYFGFGRMSFAIANGAPKNILKNESIWREILSDPLLATIHLADTIAKQKEETKRKMIARAARQSQQ